MAKYTTLTELAEAFKHGELDESYKVVIDKGGNALSLSQFKDFGYSENNTEAEDDVAHGAEDGSYEQFHEIFDREYECCLEELFKLVGIPCE